MIRQLLAILALVTGLAAVAEPAHAARLGASVETVGEAAQATPCRKPAIVLQLGGEARRTKGTRERGCLPAPQSIVVPAVQLQADRARE